MGTLTMKKSRIIFGVYMVLLVVIMLSSHRCVYGSESIPPEQKSTKMAYCSSGFREHLHPLFHFGRLCEVCTDVYP